MSVENSSRLPKPKLPLSRLPLSNITNTHHANFFNPPKSNRLTPYKSNNPYLSNNLKTKSKQNKPIKSHIIPHKSVQLKPTKGLNKLTNLRKQPSMICKPKKYSQNQSKLKETLNLLKTEVGLLHSKSMTMQQLHKELSTQVKELKDSCKVSRFMKDQTEKKMRVLDGISRGNSKALKELLKDSRKMKSKSTIEC